MGEKAGKIDANRRPGSEGLKYTDPAGVAGGPIENQSIPGINPGKGVDGSKSEPRVVKGKGGGSGKKGTGTGY